MVGTPHHHSSRSWWVNTNMRKTFPLTITTLNNQWKKRRWHQCHPIEKATMRARIHHARDTCHGCPWKGEPNLCKKPPTTLDKLRARTTRFIEMEDITRFREKVHGESSKKPAEREIKIESSYSKGKYKVDRLSRSKFSHYTPLIENWSRVLEKACGVELIQLLTKNWPPLEADKSNYCHYHRVVGHNTK